EDLRGKGNVMTREDLARYYAVGREPVMATYRGHTVYSGPPPVSGGAALVGKLNLLEQFRQMKSQREDAATVHSMIEAWKLAPSTRGRIADPGLWPVDLQPFTDKEWAKRRWQSCFDPQRSLSPGDTTCLNEDRVAAAWGVENVLDARTSTGTTAFVVADAAGNMAAVTQTLGTWGGNFYVTPGLGFIYNDKLRSYSSNTKRYNARIPFARNVTSIAPTLIFKGTGEKQQPYLAVGAAGNAWITSAVYQIVAGVIDRGLGPQQAIEQPRFLVGIRRDPKDRDRIREIVVQMEDGFAPGVLEQLQAKGHDLQRISARGELRMGYAAAALIDGKQIRAGADPRRSGQAGAVK
ncbi:MAG: gamma-glutamyltransferase, partial [bacterium]